MYETSDFRNGLKIMVDGQPYTITFFEHVKPGKGNQFSRVKMRNLLTGSNLERTFKSGERFEVPNVETQDMTYLYKDESGYNFMNKSSYEQMIMSKDNVGDAANYLVDNMDVVVLFYNEKPVTIDLPNSVILKVKETVPGFKGNTVSNTTKPATLETGYVVNVPLHINEGDGLKIDTRTGLYIERANK